MRLFFVRFIMFVIVMFSGTYCFANEYTVISDQLNMRSQPNKNAEKVTTLNKGDLVEVTDSAKGGWVKVEAQGVTGYVFGKYLEPAPEQSNPSDSIVLKSDNTYSRMNSSHFWLYFILTIILFGAYFVLAENGYPNWAMLCNFGASLCVALYASAENRDAFWFMDFDRQGFIVYVILLIVAFIVFTFLAKMLWSDLCLIKEFFHMPLVSILGILSALVLGFGLMWLIVKFFSEHTLAAFLTLIGVLPSSKAVPTPDVRRSYTDSDAYCENCKHFNSNSHTCRKNISPDQPAGRDVNGYERACVYYE